MGRFYYAVMIIPKHLNYLNYLNNQDYLIDPNHAICNL